MERKKKSIVILLISHFLVPAKRECNKTVLRKSILFIALAWVTLYKGYYETAQTPLHKPFKIRKAER